MTTYAAFVSALHGITVTGVSRKFDHTPQAVQTADLPAQYLRLPGGGINSETLTTCAGDGKTRTIELVIIGEPVGQGDVDTNFGAVVTLMDNLETALDALGDTMPMTTYAIRGEGMQVGDALHWGLVATITGTE